MSRVLGSIQTEGWLRREPRDPSLNRTETEIAPRLRSLKAPPHADSVGIRSESRPPRLEWISFRGLVIRTQVLAAINPSNSRRTNEDEEFPT